MDTLKIVLKIVAAIAIMAVVVYGIGYAMDKEHRSNLMQIGAQSVAIGQSMIQEKKTPVFMVTCELPEGMTMRQKYVGITKEVVDAAKSGTCYVVLTGAQE